MPAAVPARQSSAVRTFRPRGIIAKSRRIRYNRGRFLQRKVCAYGTDPRPGTGHHHREPAAGAAEPDLRRSGCQSGPLHPRRRRYPDGGDGHPPAAGKPLYRKAAGGRLRPERLRQNAGPYPDRRAGDAGDPDRPLRDLKRRAGARRPRLLHGPPLRSGTASTSPRSTRWWGSATTAF